MKRHLRVLGLTAMVVAFGHQGSAKDPLVTAEGKDANALLAAFLQKAKAPRETPVPTGNGKALYVAPTGGNDTVTRENNAIDSPWATPRRAWEMAQPGDVVYFRQGTWEFDTPMNAKYLGVSGTAETPITFTSYPNETATFSYIDKLVFKNGDGQGGLLWLWKEYNHIVGLNLVVRYLDSEPVNFTGAPIQTFCPNLKISYCKIENQRQTKTDNSALIHCSANSTFIEISNCRLIGPGIENMGTAGISGPYFVRTRGTKVLNNEISGCVYGIFQKHSNEVDNVPAEEYNQWHFNYIRDCGIGINGRPNRTFISNNITPGISFSAGGNGGDGYAGGDYNIIKNNTITEPPEALQLLNLNLFEFPLTSSNPDNSDPYSGCTNNIIENNIFKGSQLRLNPYGPPRPTDTGTPIVNYEYNNHTDYNLYPNTNELIREDRTSYSLQQWRDRTSTVHHRTVDANSLSGTPVFVGGETPAASAGFALAQHSLGKNAGSDGKDLGADISRVGIRTAVFALISPNGGEAWQRGESRPITWTSSGTTGNVVIELVQNGATVGVIAESVAATAGSFAWTVGHLAIGTVITGTGCKIRIRASSGSTSAQSYPF